MTFVPAMATSLIRGAAPSVVSRLLVTALFLAIDIAAAQPDSALPSNGMPWNMHFQLTTVTQWHYAFPAGYSGLNSFRNSEETASSVTSTLFAGLRLWNGGAAYLNPELSAGQGLSGTLGIAGFPNGEIYRVAESGPKVTLARMYVKQIIALGDQGDFLPDEANQLAGRIPADRLTLIAGKFSLTDFLDNNVYSHDPRTQFLNWAVMSMGAWDYAADTRGYTWGVLSEYRRPPWSIRAAAVLVPKEANQLEMDTKIRDAFSLNLEVERRYALSNRNGALRLVFFRNLARMGNYLEATTDTAYHDDITRTRQYGRTKYGVGLNAEQQLSEVGGIFARMSWNDGKNETWAFTEIDQSVCIGAAWKGNTWGRPDDNLGAAVAFNGISDQHRDYLAAGGYGFIIGDAALRYGTETILEAFYSVRVLSAIAITGDYQFIVNPAYNRDRGPVHIFGLRAHGDL